MKQFSFNVHQNCWTRHGVFLAPVMWPRSHLYLCVWWWIRTRSAIHWVQQEVFLQRSWRRKNFSNLTSLSVFALVYCIYCSFKGSKSWHIFHFASTEIRALVALHGEVLWFVSLIGRTLYFHSRSLFWLVGCEFRTNFARAFFPV